MHAPPDAPRLCSGRTSEPVRATAAVVDRRIYAAQLAADHLKCFQFPPDAAAPPDVTLLGKTWQATAGWALKIAASTPTEQLQLLGVRRCGSSRGRVAHVFYK